MRIERTKSEAGERKKYCVFLRTEVRGIAKALADEHGTSVSRLIEVLIIDADKRIRRRENRENMAHNAKG